jgi:AcrR family transcriptional regulator
MSKAGQKTAEDWLEAGLKGLRKSGPEGLRVKKLASSLGVTTGSFYWHFENVETFHRKLLDHWMQWDTTRTSSEAKQDAHPMQRLEELIEQNELLEHTDAVREWARTNEDAARAIARVEKMRHRRVTEMLVQSGLDERTASVRAQIVVWVGSRAFGEPTAWRHQVMREMMALVSPMDQEETPASSQRSGSGGGV